MSYRELLGFVGASDGALESTLDCTLESALDSTLGSALELSREARLGVASITLSDLTYGVTSTSAGLEKSLQEPQRDVSSLSCMEAALMWVMCNATASLPTALSFLKVVQHSASYICSIAVIITECNIIMQKQQKMEARRRRGREETIGTRDSRTCMWTESIAGVVLGQQAILADKHATGASFYDMSSYPCTDTDIDTDTASTVLARSRQEYH